MLYCLYFSICCCKHDILSNWHVLSFDSGSNVSIAKQFLRKHSITLLWRTSCAGAGHKENRLSQCNIFFLIFITVLRTFSTYVVKCFSFVGGKSLYNRCPFCFSKNIIISWNQLINSAFMDWFSTPLTGMFLFNCVVL